MSGTDHKSRKVRLADKLEQPAIILVEPQMGENIGAAARAMLNCGLNDLRLVNPRDGWPNISATVTSAGAIGIIEPVRIFETTDEAIADLSCVYAATARRRDLTKKIITPRIAATEMRQMISQKQKPGILFGGERSGLNNEDVSRSHAVINVPLNPGFSSLNLGQAVLLTCYEWYQEPQPQPEERPPNEDYQPANQADFDNFFNRLVEKLDERNFFPPSTLRPITLRNLRNFYNRAIPTKQEIRTLHGTISALIRSKDKAE